jgi:hypothetical protein
MRNKGCSRPLTLEKSQMLENTNIGLKFTNVVVVFLVILSITFFFGDEVVKNSVIPTFQ